MMVNYKGMIFLMKMWSRNNGDTLQWLKEKENSMSGNETAEDCKRLDDEYEKRTGWN